MAIHSLFWLFLWELGEGAISPASTDTQRRAEQLVLYIRALQLLSSALNLSKEELQAERLHPSPSVKQVRLAFDGLIRGNGPFKC